jgi:hypothetical protein
MNFRVILIGLGFLSLLALILLGTMPSTASATAHPGVAPGATPTATRPPLVSANYLHDISLITQRPCAPPCFHGITVGQTTFADALNLLKKDPAFANIQDQSFPNGFKVATWSTAQGQQPSCCHMSADQNTGLVDVILINLAPNLAAWQIIRKYGPPAYVSYVDYSQQEVALGLVYPKQGFVTWMVPGGPNSKLEPSNPVVVVLYTDPNEFNMILDTATFQGWNGYLPYKTYKEATPIVTPIITATPDQ